MAQTMMKMVALVYLGYILPVSGKGFCPRGELCPGGNVRTHGYVRVQRREEDDCAKRILEADVRGQRSRGRQRKRWIDVLKCNMEDLRLNLVDVENRAEWRRRTGVADLSPEGSTAWK